MGSSSDDFQSLQKLLRLKRYEQPPPRYFNEFSGNVISRIRAGEARSARHWWECFGFDLRPAITIGAAVAACGMLLATVGFGFENDAAQAGLAAGAALAASVPLEKAPDNSLATMDAQGAVSTKPVMNNSGGVMPSLLRVGLQPVSFTPGRN